MEEQKIPNLQESWQSEGAKQMLAEVKRLAHESIDSGVYWGDISSIRVDIVIDKLRAALTPRAVESMWLNDRELKGEDLIAEADKRAQEVGLEEWLGKLREKMPINHKEAWGLLDKFIATNVVIRAKVIELLEGKESEATAKARRMVQVYRKIMEKPGKD